MQTQAATLDAIWADALEQFPLSEGYGVDVGLHHAGFFTSTVSQKPEGGEYFMLAYATADSAIEALRRATEAAERNRAASITWLGKPIANFAAQGTA